MKNQVTRFQGIFWGNTEAYGADDGRAVRCALTPAVFTRHLTGEEGIGIYPLYRVGITPDAYRWVCKWGCTDIDTGDWGEAYAVATALRAMGMVPHVERSRSKGWHIWVFPAEPLLGSDMRRAFKVAHAAAGVKPKEVNPKQETLAEGQLGNYVRLPFKGGLVDRLSRQVMMRDWSETGDGSPVQFMDWIDRMYESPNYTPPEAIQHWASKWHEPEKTIVSVETIHDDELNSLLGDVGPDLALFIQNGPPHDRSGGLVALAYKLRAKGYTATETYGLVSYADSRWGKYTSRPNRDVYLMDIIERVYQ